MASLEFAFVAESARVDGDGGLSALGIGFTGVLVPELPQPLQIAVAGLVWVYPHDPPTVPLAVSVEAPDELYRFAIETMLRVSPDEPVLEDGKRAILFRIPITIPLVTTGFHRLELELADELVKAITFVVAEGAEPNGNTGT